MTTATTLTVSTSRPTRIAAMLRGVAMAAADWWSLYRTRQILSGLDERTLKDIGAPDRGGAGVSVDPRYMRQLDMLR